MCSHVQNTNLNGIRIEACPGPVRVINNIINSSEDAGIWVGDSSYETTIFNNSICENRFGILFGRDTNQDQGVFSSVISQNRIYDNMLYGVELSYSYDNVISNNVIANTLRFGVNILYPCENNEVMENNFFDNNIWGTSQASDDGSNNTFHNNFWNDHTAPDSNYDGIVDLPYAIHGEAENQDLYPLTRATDAPPRLVIPANIVYGVIFLLFILGVLVIILRKNRK